MEVKIGVQHSPRELVIDSPKTPDEIQADVAAAMSGSTKDGLLTLVCGWPEIGLPETQTDLILPELAVRAAAAFALWGFRRGC